MRNKLKSYRTERPSPSQDLSNKNTTRQSDQRRFVRAGSPLCRSLPTMKNPRKLDEARSCFMFTSAFGQPSSTCARELRAYAAPSQPPEDLRGAEAKNDFRAKTRLLFSLLLFSFLAFLRSPTPSLFSSPSQRCHSAGGRSRQFRPIPPPDNYSTSIRNLWNSCFVTTPLTL